MPGLIRGMARTAAVVGTATATRNAVNRHQANKNVQAQANAMNQAYPQQQPQYVMQASGAQPSYIVEAPPPMEMAPAMMEAPPSQDDVITQLERLGALLAQGILTEEEFAAQKAKLLGM